MLLDLCRLFLCKQYLLPTMLMTIFATFPSLLLRFITLLTRPFIEMGQFLPHADLGHSLATVARKYSNTVPLERREQSFLLLTDASSGTVSRLLLSSDAGSGSILFLFDLFVSSINFLIFLRQKNTIGKHLVTTSETIANECWKTAKDIFTFDSRHDLLKFHKLKCLVDSSAYLAHPSKRKERLRVQIPKSTIDDSWPEFIAGSFLQQRRLRTSSYFWESSCFLFQILCIKRFTKKPQWRVFLNLRLKGRCITI